MRVPWKTQWLGAGVWGMLSNPRVRAGVDYGETDLRELREAIVKGNACGGNSGSHGSKAILLSQA